MSTLALKALTFVKDYWPYLLIVGLFTWAVWERGDYQSCKAARTADKAAALQAIIDQKNKDRELNDKIVTDQAQTIARLANRTDTYIKEIHNVPVTTDCGKSPAMRASDVGMRGLGYSSDPGPAVGANDGKAGAPAAGAGKRNGQR